MEALSEPQRQLEGNLSHDVPIKTPEWDEIERMVDRLLDLEDESGAA